jgi:hypothetical protein
MAERRFPPPWEIEDNGACFIVRDHSGQSLAYLYCECDNRHKAHLPARKAEPHLRIGRRQANSRANRGHGSQQPTSINSTSASKQQRVT